MIGDQPEILSLRGALYVDVIIACVLLVSVILFGLRGRHWTLRLVAVGVLGVFAYALTGQLKAVKLGIPFDGTSWIGLVSFSLVNIALSAALLRAMWSDVLDRK